MKKSQIQRSFHAAKNDLVYDYVPKHLGFHHIDHDTFAEQHTTPLAKALFTSETSKAAVLVMDGTYIYIQKSSDYHFQRVSYSMHKHRPIVKMMVIIGSDGYVLSVLGPYRADRKNNDASITKHMFKSNAENLADWISDDDVCIVDREFRDSVDFLKSYSLQVEMPYYLTEDLVTIALKKPISPT